MSYLIRSKCCNVLLVTDCSKKKITSFLGINILAEKFSLGSFKYESKYDEHDQKYILHTVNHTSASTDASPLSLSSFSLSKSRIQRLDLWRNKHGHFTSLGQILEVEGFGVKALDKFCENIINIRDNKIPIKVMPSATKKITNLTTPILHDGTKQDIQSCVSVTVGVSSVAWSTISRSPAGICLVNWGMHDFTNESKRWHLVDIVELVLRISQLIPRSKFYILEGPPSSVPTNPGPKTIVANSQRMQVISMLSAILANQTVVDYNDSLEIDGMCRGHNATMKDNSVKTGSITHENADDEKLSHGLYYLRPLLAARLYGTLVGTERVSTENVVLDLLRNAENYEYADKQQFSNDSAVDSTQTPAEKSEHKLHVSHFLTHMYISANPVHREQLGQSLLLGMTFMQVCVNNDKKCIDKISSRFYK